MQTKPTSGQGLDRLFNFITYNCKEVTVILKVAGGNH